MNRIDKTKEIGSICGRKGNERKCCEHIHVKPRPYKSGSVNCSCEDPTDKRFDEEKG